VGILMNVLTSIGNAGLQSKSKSKSKKRSKRMSQKRKWKSTHVGSFGQPSQSVGGGVTYSAAIELKTVDGDVEVPSSNSKKKAYIKEHPDEFRVQFSIKRFGPSQTAREDVDHYASYSSQWIGCNSYEEFQALASVIAEMADRAKAKLPKKIAVTKKGRAKKSKELIL